MRKITTEDFIKRIKYIHKDDYDYSLVKYFNQKQKIKLKCNYCNIVSERYPSDILYKKSKCSCLSNKQLTSKQFFSKLENRKYTYNIESYINMTSHIEVICPIHGKFKIIAGNHLYKKSGCVKCSGLKKLTTEKYIQQCKDIHLNKYDYTNVSYINDKTKVEIICKEHGVFFQRAGDHKQGQGCLKCKESKGEKRIRNVLESNNIKFIQEKTFNDCKDKTLLRFDFYLIDYNICIEYDGIQHFEEVKHFGGYEALCETQRRDVIKNEYCKTNNIQLIRINYKENKCTMEKIMNYINS